MAGIGKILTSESSDRRWHLSGLNSRSQRFLLIENAKRPPQTKFQLPNMFGSQEIKSLWVCPSMGAISIWQKIISHVNEMISNLREFYFSRTKYLTFEANIWFVEVFWYFQSVEICVTSNSDRKGPISGHYFSQVNIFSRGTLSGPPSSQQQRNIWVCPFNNGLNSTRRLDKGFIYWSHTKHMNNPPNHVDLLIGNFHVRGLRTLPARFWRRGHTISLSNQHDLVGHVQGSDARFLLNQGVSDFALRGFLVTFQDKFFGTKVN